MGRLYGTYTVCPLCGEWIEHADFLDEWKFEVNVPSDLILMLQARTTEGRIATHLNAAHPRRYALWRRLRWNWLLTHF